MEAGARRGPLLAALRARVGALSGGLCEGASPASQLEDKMHEQACGTPAATAATQSSAEPRPHLRRDQDQDQDQDNFVQQPQQQVQDQRTQDQEQDQNRDELEHGSEGNKSFRAKLGVDLSIFPRQKGADFELWSKLDKRAGKVDALLDSCRKVLVANVELERVWNRLLRQKVASDDDSSVSDELNALKTVCQRSVIDFDEVGARLAKELTALYSTRAALSAASERMDGLVLELRATGEDSDRLTALIQQKENQAQDARRLIRRLDEALLIPVTTTEPSNEDEDY
ncbi:Hypothetical Protein FCC1311_062152 [Hondaea fermentalgiana]|uniref:Uncharacterized protein n=1 Tax=Hondaea fermentalgiana TaxID=2315210 RepID=A0A2R5GHD2_9STRA|nr:Hypothetical Protein FCC1311_062152 [Hondaea fermentalgiana]|eukprot:GBG29995.1 Hypothetical Protein FCC1311_062152 [Hondaea fermentalgiana]